MSNNFIDFNTCLDLFANQGIHIKELYLGGTRAFYKPETDAVSIYSDDFGDGRSGFQFAANIGGIDGGSTEDWMITGFYTDGTNKLLVEVADQGVQGQIPGVNTLTVHLDEFSDVVVTWNASANAYVSTSKSGLSAFFPTDNSSITFSGVVGAFTDYGGPYPTILNTGSIIGTGKIGDVHTISGTQNNCTNLLEYKWRRNASYISGATSTSYTPVQADDQTQLDFELTASNPYGTDIHISANIDITWYEPVTSMNVLSAIELDAYENETISFGTYITVQNDANKNSVTYTVSSGGIDGMTMNASTGVYSGIPSDGQDEANLVVTISNSGGNTTITAPVTVNGDPFDGNFYVVAAPIDLCNSHAMFWDPYSPNTAFEELTGDTTPARNDGQVVGTWYAEASSNTDGTGNTYSPDPLVAPTTAARPVLSEVRGRLGMTFDGSDDTLFSRFIGETNLYDGPKSMTFGAMLYVPSGSQVNYACGVQFRNDAITTSGLNQFSPIRLTFNGGELSATMKFESAPAVETTDTDFWGNALDKGVWHQLWIEVDWNAFDGNTDTDFLYNLELDGANNEIDAGADMASSANTDTMILDFLRLGRAGGYGVTTTNPMKMTIGRFFFAYEKFDVSDKATLKNWLGGREWLPVFP